MSEPKEKEDEITDQVEQKDTTEKYTEIEEVKNTTEKYTVEEDYTPPETTSDIKFIDQQQSDNIDDKQFNQNTTGFFKKHADNTGEEFQSIDIEKQVSPPALPEKMNIDDLRNAVQRNIEMEERQT